MIHLRPEGGPVKSGLNVTFGKWWVSFIYTSIDLSSYTGINYSFRIRITPKYPKLFFGKHKDDLINSFLWDRDLKIITRSEYQDFVEPYYKKREIIDGN
jgi:hypothetical protein